MKTIIVMPGSFNPMTKGHYYAMKTALNHFDNSLGIFIPASFSYIKDKMKTKTHPLVINDYDRIEIINDYIKNDKNIIISDIELNGTLTSNHTYLTLNAIKQMYFNCNIYLLVGTDELSFMTTWQSKDKLLNEYMFVVSYRDGSNPHDIINHDELLSKYKSHFIFLNEANKIDISSSKIRELFLSGDSKYKDYLCNSALLILDKLKKNQ